jgi:hypothetical protein
VSHFDQEMKSFIVVLEYWIAYTHFNNTFF